MPPPFATLPTAGGRAPGAWAMYSSRTDKATLLSPFQPCSALVFKGL
jgi:hypothetical protein